MMAPLTRAATHEVMRAVLAADCACTASAFVEDGLLITAAEERPRDAIFAAETIAELAQLVEGYGQMLHGPAMKYACAAETFRPAAGVPDISVDVIQGEAVHQLYQWPGFDNALSYRPDHPRPDVAAAVARRDGRIVGIAGASDDCDALWQLGIDIVPGARGAGIGRALVGCLTELAFQRGRIPHYATAVANLRSQALALGLGYWPARIELHARNLPPTAPKPRSLTKSMEAR